MALVRSIARWTMTAMVINSLIGSGIFALPGQLNSLLGRASPFALISVGGVVSPLLSNLYLNDVDRMLEEIFRMAEDEKARHR